MRSARSKLHNGIVCALLLATTDRNFGCTCIGISPKEALRKATVVFHGRAVNVEHVRSLEAPDPLTGQTRRWIPEKDDITVVTFQVDAFWKGPATSIIKVFSVARPSMCNGYQFLVGEEYLVYGDPLGAEQTELRNRFKGDVLYEIGPCPPPVRPGGMQMATGILGKAKMLKSE